MPPEQLEKSSSGLGLAHHQPDRGSICAEPGGSGEMLSNLTQGKTVPTPLVAHQLAVSPHVVHELSLQVAGA